MFAISTNRCLGGQSGLVGCLGLRSSARATALGRHKVSRSAGRHVPRIRAASDSPSEPDKHIFALAPSKPTSPQGEMVAYYLQMQPHLFQEAVETAFEKIREQREGEEAAGSPSPGPQAQQQPPQQPPPPPDGADLVLYHRLAELRRAEQRVAIEDLMYVCILERFQDIGVPLLPSVAPMEESTEALKALTEGVHTREALDMVKEHVLAILGPASVAFSNTLIKMSKLQAAQVYAASIMFGYFLRRVDTRFQLSRRMGLLAESTEDTVARLERLFAQADHPESSDEGSAGGSSEQQQQAQASTSYGAVADKQEQQQQQGQQRGLQKRSKSALRRYVESFDQNTMIETARLVTVEGAALVERQTRALFGDIKQLQQQMQEAVGKNAISMEDLMQRVQQAVAEEAVESVTMTVGTQRRAVLEAVAYGCFLRDVETDVEDKYALLTPLSSAGGPGGMAGV